MFMAKLDLLAHRRWDFPAIVLRAGKNNPAQSC
jgi:hypothetical protein